MTVLQIENMEKAEYYIITIVITKNRTGNLNLYGLSKVHHYLGESLTIMDVWILKNKN
jgi:hypothetical protein